MRGKKAMNKHYLFLGRSWKYYVHHGFRSH